MYKKFRWLDFGLLLIYSLLPGIYKILDNQLLMAFSIPIIFILLYYKKKSITLKKLDLCFLFFLFYLLSLCILQYFFPNANKMGVLMGVFLDMTPMLGYFYSRKIDFEDFVRILMPVGIIHLSIGILLYPMFGLSMILGDIAPILLEGIAFGRMSSVSGSLGFASLMFMTSICALYYRKKCFYILLIGVVCAAQRSGWLACALACLFYGYATLKKRNTALLIGQWTVGVFTFIFLLSYVVSILDFDISFFKERFNDIGNATSERNEQWISGIDNFMNMPIGTGCGQVGQVAARYESGTYLLVPDGDYFRVLSEYGFGGVFFYTIFFTLFLFSCFSVNKSYSLKKCCLLSLFGGISIQMIGSNITEFYFTNFLYWTFMGYLFCEFNTQFVMKKKILI